MAEGTGGGKIVRLIDVDALKTERGMAYRCEDCKHDARMCQFNQDYTRMDICSMLDDVHTVDAIPVGWLESVLNEAKKYPRVALEIIVAIPYLIKRWRREQEGEE